MQQALPKTILVPTDFSDVSREALHRAADVAQACSARLTVMYADSFAQPPETSDDDLAVRVEQSKLAAAEHLQDEVRSQVPANIPVDTMVIVDNPVHAILHVAKEKDLDWIVMGTHGRTGVRRFVLGSVTEEVLRHADRPVLTIHPA
jgi:nucleotide-binding universal stress UspA family protein